MKRKLKMLARATGLKLARALGTDFVDVRTGQRLGRGLVLGWRGRVHVIGLETPVRPEFVPQQRLTYWKQELGFSKNSPPDFPSLHNTSHAGVSSPQSDI